jgi:predicted permease
MVKFLRVLTAKIRGLFGGRTSDRELDDEIKAHVGMLTERYIDQGMSEAEAARAARRQFGNVTLLQEANREMRGIRWIDALIQDVRYGVRMMLKAKALTAVALLSLAIGIGGNTAIFSLMDALLLRSLPVNDPEELVLFSLIGPNVRPGAGNNLSFPLYEMIRAGNQSFSGVLLAGNIERARFLVIEPGASVEPIESQPVSGDFFSTLGVSAVVGRTLTLEDDDPANTESPAVISYEYWRRRFGLDPNVAGRRIKVNDTPLTIVGVAPPGFFGMEVARKPELWLPIRNSHINYWREPRTYVFKVFGRLRPGVNRAAAQAEAETIFRLHLDETAAALPPNWTPGQRRNHFERSLQLEPGGAGYTWLRRAFREPLLILAATVILTLLIACVNIANLLLARAAARRKEIAMRLALGAGRRRLMRQLLTESVMLSAFGGTTGLLLAPLCLRGLLSYLSPQTQDALRISLDARALGFTLVVSVLTGLLFGLAPAWQATRLDLTSAIKDQTRVSAGRLRLTLHKSLIVAQVALSLYLLIGAGLFVRSLRNLRTADVGFNYENTLQFGLDEGAGYKDERRSQIYKQMLSRLEALPGARSATLLHFSLLRGQTRFMNVQVPGHTPGPDETPNCNVMVVGPRFFESMEIPILTGRDFGPQDERPLRVGSAHAAEPLYTVVNQAMARHYFGDENPIGKRFFQDKQPTEIIGVVKDSKYATIREPTPRTFYLYYFQLPRRDDLTFQLRTTGDLAAYGAAIPRLAREINPQLQVLNLRTMDDVINELLLQDRFLAETAGAFSLFGLLLASIGLFGVLSYTVARRTNEIGVRMALGAQTRDIMRLVMKEAALLVALGMCIGLAAAMATTRLAASMFSMLFGLAPVDPLTITLAASLLISVAALAGYLPARRASRVDPMIALRVE